MDVRLPDGTVIRGVPDGTTKADLISKLSSNGYDVSKFGGVPQESTQTQGWTPYTPSGEAERTTQDKTLGLSLEGTKGLLRGASNVADAVKRAGTMMHPAGPALNMLSKFTPSLPTISQQTVQPTPSTKPEQFVGTAGEVLGGAIAGGGAGTARNAAVSVGSALGAGTGEQVGGDTGKFLGMLAGAYGTSAAMAIARKLGVAAADIAAVFGTGFGNKAGIERLASKAVTAKAGADAPQIQAALKAPTQYVKGSPVTVGEAITEAQMGKPQQFGGAVVRMQKDLYGAQGVEDVLPTVAKQQTAAAVQHLDDLATKTDPMREASLKAANAPRIPGGLEGVRTDSVVSNLDTALSKPGLRASAIVQKTMGSIKEKLAGATNSKGMVEANDLYTIRKEIGNTIQQHSKETANWDKRLTGGLASDIQKSIDDAIEAAGGAGWKDYLSTYSAGRRAVDMQGDRLKAMKLLQAQVKGSSPSQVVSGEILHPPTLLNRPMMLANYALKLVAKDANAPVVKRVAEAMRNPDDFAKLIKLPTTHPDRKVVDYIVNYMVATKMDQAAKELAEQ